MMPRHADARATALFRIMILTSTVLVSAGCANKPGSLHLELTAREADQSGRIPLDVRLAAVGSDVVLVKHPDWRYEFTDEATGEVVGTGQEWVGYCGTALAALWPLIPAVAAFRLLDVADLSGQFDVIGAGQQTTRTLYVVLDRSHPLAVTRSQEYDAPAVAGRYRLKLELVPPAQGFDPLFWQAYPYPASAETTLRFECPAQSNHGANSCTTACALR